MVWVLTRYADVNQLVFSKASRSVATADCATVRSEMFVALSGQCLLNQGKHLQDDMVLHTLEEDQAPQSDYTAGPTSDRYGLSSLIFDECGIIICHLIRRIYCRRLGSEQRNPFIGGQSIVRHPLSGQLMICLEWYAETWPDYLRVTSFVGCWRVWRNGGGVVNSVSLYCCRFEPQHTLN